MLGSKGGRANVSRLFWAPPLCSSAAAHRCTVWQPTTARALRPARFGAPPVPGAPPLARQPNPARARLSAVPGPHDYSEAAHPCPAPLAALGVGGGTSGFAGPGERRPGLSSHTVGPTHTPPGSRHTPCRQHPGHAMLGAERCDKIALADSLGPCTAGPTVSTVSAVCFCGLLDWSLASYARSPRALARAAPLQQHAHCRPPNS